MGRHLLLLAILLSAGSTFAQSSFIVSERIGETVDGEERAYFGLLPDIADFESMTATTGAFDGVRLIVSRSTEPDTTISLSSEAARALRGYIETFEQHPTAYLNPNYQLVRALVDPAVPVPYVNVDYPDVVLETADRTYPGVLLSARDSLILLQPPHVAFDWRAGRVIVLEKSDIELVRPQAIGRERLRGKLLALGAIAGVGGAAAISNSAGQSFGAPQATATMLLGVAIGYSLTNFLWPRALSPGSLEEREAYLREHASFSEKTPFDLPPTYELTDNDDSFPSTASRRGSASSIFRRWHETYKWVSVGAFGWTSLSDSDPNSFDEFFVNRTPDQTQPHEVLRSNSAFDGGFDISIRPIPWLRIGSVILKNDGPVVQDSMAEESSFTIPRSGIRPYIEIILPSPRYRGFALDLGIGFGLESNEIVVSRATSGRGVPLTFESSEEVSNRFFQATIEGFFSPESSIFVRYTKRSLPLISVPELVELFPNDPNQTIYRAGAHDVTFGYSTLSFGTRLHL